MRHRLIAIPNLCAAFVLYVAGVASGQSPTVPERAAANKGEPLEIVILNDLPVTPLAALATSDLIVRGKLLNPRSYLSEDEHHIYTEYELLPIQVIRNRGIGLTHPQPGIQPTLRVTLYGGELVIGGTHVTMRDLLRVPWTAGADLLLFLKRDETKPNSLRPYGGPAGIFEIVPEGRVKALRRRGKEEEKIEAMPFDDLVSEILAAADR